MKARGRWLVVASMLWLGAPAPAHADGLADEAELAFQVGAERYRNGQFREALLSFLASNRLVPNRNVMFNIGRTYERLRRFPESYRWYLDALEGERDPVVIAAVEEALALLTPRVAVLDVSTEPPGAVVYLERKDLGSVARAPRRVAVASGQYRVIVELPGHEDAEVVVEAEEGAAMPVHLVLRRIVGWVEVEASAGTTVHVGDEETPAVCEAPCRVELPPGLHVLHFHQPGFRLRPRQVRVVAGRTRRVHAAATPRTGSILVTADVRDADVHIEGQRVGFTPTIVPDVPVGERRVRVSLRGYRPVERVVVVREGEQTRLEDVSLVPVREVSAASRMNEAIDDAPGSISVISAEEIAAFGYPTIAEALRGTRGVALSYDSAYTSVAVRGLGAPNDYGNRLLVLQDGAVLNDNILFQSFTGFDGRVDLSEVERIELVRGPGSVLYGTGAVSGVVNLVSRGPGEPTSGFVSLGTVYDNVARARAGFQANLGDDGYVRLSVSGARTGGFDVSLEQEDGAAVAHGVGRMRAATVQGALRYRSVALQAFFTEHEQRIPTGIFGTRFDDDGTRWRDSRALLDLRFEPELGAKAQLLTRVHANLYRFHERDVYDGEEPNEDQATTHYERYRGSWVGGEVRLLTRPAEQLRISAGAEVRANFQAELQGAYDEGDGEREQYLDASEPYQVYAAYGLFEWIPSAAVRATAGLRMDAWSTFGVSLNPRLTLVLKPSEANVLKLIAGRAFRAPSIYELRYEDAGNSQVRPDAVPGNSLSPESLYSVELEYVRSFGAHLSLLAAVHFQWASSLVETAQVEPEDPASLIYYRNGATERYAAGADLELRREFHGGFMAAVSYGYLEARFAELPEEAETDSRRVPFAPRHFASGRAVVPVGDLPLRVATRVTLEAPRRLGLGSNEETDAAVVADLVLSGHVRDYGLRYSAGAYNLFDWRYQLPVGDVLAAASFPQRGRTFLASLDLTF